MRRLLGWRRSLALALVVIGGTGAGLWFAPSGEYLLLPDEAKPVEPLVAIDGKGEVEETADATGSGIYMVDILVRKASLLERLFPGLHDGATLVPDEVLNPVGVSEQQRRQSSRLDMTRSQQIAAAVALRALGYDVDAVPVGAEISLVLPDSPAAGADLEPGDVIVRAHDVEVLTPPDLRAALADLEPGAEVTITVERDGEPTDHTIATEAAEDEPERAVIGVLVQQAAEIDLPVEIEIDAGSIGGPSAGLAFALHIVDELGPDVDRGRTVVATGEILLDGSVGAIGGIRQKVIGARRADADVLVVPEDNAEEARRYADGLRVVSVETFSEALSALGATS
ncbi:MAG: PDZ domain-containing protein [Thermoleophilia bacterium]|nr:PDZ domain-containing protein [Thermoleophilia bacterium]